MKPGGFLKRNTPLKAKSTLKRTGFVKKASKPALPSVSKIKKQCDKLVKDIVKIRDKYICQKCGKHTSGSDCHGSHVVPVSAGNKLAFDEQNLKVLCYHCHINWWHKHPLEAAAWFNATFPDRALYLEQNKGIKQMKLLDWFELREILETKFKFLENK